MRVMDSEELSEWAAYYDVEPFGEERGDFRNAMLCSLVQGIVSKRRVKLGDWMPFEIKPEPTPEDAKVMMEFWQMVGEVEQEIAEKKAKRAEPTVETHGE